MRDLLVALTYPPALTLLLLGVAAALSLRLRWRRPAVLVAVAALAWSGLWSIPVASQWLRGTLEQRYPLLDEASAPRADAIVVLGGGDRYGWMRREEVSADELPYSRLAAGARLWLAQRAPVVILSGGGQGRRTEARGMARAIVRLGVPSRALVLEEHSTDTRENADYTVDIARARGMRRVLLVTSALHMPRARALFRRAGVEVTAVPVPEPGIGPRWTQRWLPRPRALWRSGRALKEYAALLALHLQSMKMR